jgi:hypothetical protein
MKGGGAAMLRCPFSLALSRTSRRMFSGADERLARDGGAGACANTPCNLWGFTTNPRFSVLFRTRCPVSSTRRFCYELKPLECAARPPKKTTSDYSLRTVDFIGIGNRRSSVAPN